MYEDDTEFELVRVSDDGMSIMSSQVWSTAGRMGAVLMPAPAFSLLTADQIIRRIRRMRYIVHGGYISPLPNLVINPVPGVGGALHWSCPKFRRVASLALPYTTVYERRSPHNELWRVAACQGTASAADWGRRLTA